MTDTCATWQERQAAIIAARPALVWANETWWSNNDFAAPCVRRPGLISYVESPEKGARGVRTAIKPGRYLAKRFYASLTEQQIKFFAEWQATGTAPVRWPELAAAELRFAATPDEIETIYTSGPHSCMSDCGISYESKPRHPVRVYGAGDLEIAYLCTSDGCIIARALTWPAKKAAGRIYPTPEHYTQDGFECAEHSKAAHTELKNRLKSMRYTLTSEKADILNGARMLRIKHSDNKFVMPYLDNGYKLNDDDDFLIMHIQGKYEADSSDGLALIDAKDEREICQNCARRIDENYDVMVYTSRREEVWCVRCTNQHAFYCKGFAKYLSNENDSSRINDQTYSKEWLKEYAIWSDFSKEWILDDDGVKMDNGETWSTKEFRDHGFTCAATGRKLPDRERR